MKNFLKHFLTKNNFFLILIFVVAAGIRFYNFPSRVTFWSEQARSLIVSANYIKVKPGFLGQEYFRQDSNSHTIYSGALFNYSLVPLLLISNYDPVKITSFFVVLNLFTGFVVYWVAKKMFGLRAAVISTIIFLFNDYMIYHSLFIWNYNYLPLIGVLVFYYSWKYLKKHNKIDLFLSGLFSGIGISLQFLFAPVALLILVVNMWKNKKWFIGIPIFTLGIILGNLPLVLFDLRHNFYEFRTLFQYLIDTLAGKSDAGFVYYYLLPFWPILAVMGGLIILWFWKKSRFLAALTVILYLILNLTSSRINWKVPTGMPHGITTKDIDNTSKMIAADANGNFNVSEVLDFDKRAYVLRYFLDFKYVKAPLSEVDYQNINLLYVLAPKGYTFENSSVWEVNAAGLKKVVKVADIGSSDSLYKLSKNEN